MVKGIQLASGDSGRGLALSNQSGVFQLYAWDLADTKLSLLTHHPEGKLQALLSPDGRYVYYLDDNSGNETGHWVRIPFEGGEPLDLTPDLPLYSASFIGVSRSTNRIGFTTATADGFRAYVIDEVNGTRSAPRLLYHAQAFLVGPLLSHTGEIGVVASNERTGKLEFSLFAFDAASGQQLGELWDGPNTSIEPVKFSPVPGDLRLVATSNRTGVNRPLLWKPRSGERFDLGLGDLEGDVVPADWSADGDRLLLLQMHQAHHQLYIYRLSTGALTRLEHPGGNYRPYASAFGNVTCFGPGHEIFAVWQNSTHPPQVIALDENTGQQTRTVLPAGDTPPGHAWSSIHFPSSDGQDIQAWLALPDGQGPFPTILETHGGPHLVMTDEFVASSQAWLDHGFAYLSINYRGSTTFGKAFQEKIWGDIGHWELEDVVAGREWLVRQGIAKPDQIMLTGWSYGGYLTLLPLGKRPELWAGGMAGVAIADWAVGYEDAAATLRKFEVGLFGGTPEQIPDKYKASSPITYADQVKAPVLIIQGRNDTRTPARPVEMYEAKLKASNKPIEVIWYEAGHAGSRAQVELSISHQEQMLRFAYRILGQPVEALPVDR
jgi:dienelactone hydrolase